MWVSTGGVIEEELFGRLDENVTKHSEEGLDAWG